MMIVVLVQILLYSSCFAEGGPEGTSGVELGKECLGLQFPVITVRMIWGGLDLIKVPFLQDGNKMTFSQNVSSNTIELSTLIQPKPDKRCMQKVVMEEKVKYDEVL